MSAHAHDSSNAVHLGPISPEALEAAPKAWYDDLKMDQVIVAAFVSTVLSLASIFFVQGLYAQLTSAEINAKDKRDLISPGQAIINGQIELLEKAQAPAVLTERTDGDRYYGELGSAQLSTIDAAKKATLEAYGPN